MRVEPSRGRPRPLPDRLPRAPRPQRGAAFEAVEATPGAQKRFLHGILRFEGRGEHPVAVTGEFGAVLVEVGRRRPGRERGLLHGDILGIAVSATTSPCMSLAQWTRIAPGQR